MEQNEISWSTKESNTERLAQINDFISLSGRAEIKSEKEKKKGIKVFSIMIQRPPLPDVLRTRLFLSR